MSTEEELLQAIYRNTCDVDRMSVAQMQWVIHTVNLFTAKYAHLEEDGECDKN